MSELKGQLTKMSVQLSNSGVAEYMMRLGEQQLEMNGLIGQAVKLSYHQQINCIHCQRLTKKSFSGGYCYPCSQRLAQCDLCFMKPETCHYEQGTCREPDWGQQVCMQDHIVYLANSSGLKVGITRLGQIPTRWIDQGASQAIPIFRVKTRYQSGLVEVMFKEHVSDRTDWRKMLKGQPELVDLAAERDRLFDLCKDNIQELQAKLGDDQIQLLPAEQAVSIDYPVSIYPEKVRSHNFDKTPEVSGQLQGIKGQYLIFDTGVINIRKFTGYQVSIEA